MPVAFVVCFEGSGGKRGVCGGGCKTKEKMGGGLVGNSYYLPIPRTMDAIRVLFVYLFPVLRSNSKIKRHRFIQTATRSFWGKELLPYISEAYIFFTGIYPRKSIGVYKARRLHCKPTSKPTQATNRTNLTSLPF